MLLVCTCLLGALKLHADMSMGALLMGAMLEHLNSALTLSLVWYTLHNVSRPINLLLPFLVIFT